MAHAEAGWAPVPSQGFRVKEFRVCELRDLGV